MAVPTRDVLFVPFSNNVNARIVAEPSLFALSPEQAAKYNELHELYVGAYAEMVAAREAGIRSEAQTLSKDQAKSNLLAYAREIYAIVQSSQSVADSDKALLGVHIPKEWSRVPAPDGEPVIEITQVSANIVSYRVHERGVHQYRLPKNVTGVNLYTHIGENPSPQVKNWKFAKLSSRATGSIEISTDTQPFARVWLTAQWTNRRGQVSVAAKPVSTNLGAWLVQDAQSAILKAA